ncbi:helix-turn-helix transcriptional regulator [Melissococcus plutonius]|uniref:helix-turn-helix transcriptional regulator n=1 Tax=Melissococcus plutonius TaxID=33970 RepID=UPI003C2FC4CB
MKTTLKGLRATLNLTQEEMAKKVGVSEDTWRNYEKYKSYPNVLIINNILSLTGVDYDDIIFLPHDYGLNVNVKLPKIS